MPLYDFLCEKCNHVKEELFHSTEKVLDEIDCPKCDGKMKKQICGMSYLPETSDMMCRIHRAEKTMGTGNLEPKQLPRNTGPRMWPGPKGRTVGVTP